MAPNDGSLPNYVIAASRPERPAVELWSHHRLPFEAKGELRTMRDDLRVALSHLEPTEGHALYGCYTSGVQDYQCDAENILFYNVKDAGFPHLCRSGFVFERSFQLPPVPPRPMAIARHHHYYEMRPVGGAFRCWVPARTIVSWREIPIEPLTSEVKPAPLWHAMKTAALGVEAATGPPAVFGLRVTVGVPRTARFSVASAVKPLLDGIMSGLHVHDGHDLSDLSVRLADQLGTAPHVISQLLMSDRGAALGERRLLHLRGQGVQWNPADDRCVAAEILVANGDGGWRLSGEIFAVEELGD
ncbi:MAG: hypothetical protein HY874_07230 [Chloroflexi bacterium]|nr:hypothetical protein [Chloroflexota bacterium]